MKYAIVVNGFAATTCDLTKELFEKLLEQCDELSEDYDKCHSHIAEGKRPVLAFQQRKTWMPTENEKQLDDDLENGVVPFPATIVKIFPATILKDVPLEFNSKKIKYKEWKTRYDKNPEDVEKKSSDWLSKPILSDWRVIEHVLNIASEIRSNYQEADSKRSSKSSGSNTLVRKGRAPKGKNVESKLANLIARNPEYADLPSEKLASLVGCSKTAILGTPTWKKICGSRRKPEIESWNNPDDIPDNRSQEELD